MDCSCFATMTLLFLLPSIDLILSLECSSTQYSRPKNNPQRCCNMCKPGTYMEKRDDWTCEITCRRCSGERYSDVYQARSCKVCDKCNIENMEQVSPCNSTHNIVCGCKAGFKCGDKTCSSCTKLTTTKAPPTITHRTTAVSTKPIQDTIWFIIIICLIFVTICLVIVTKIKPLLNWFSPNKRYCKATVFMHENEEEENEQVSTPIQEMCDKCDQPIEE